MNFYLDAWKKFVKFGGRARRKEFWFFSLINGVVMSLLQMLPAHIGTAGWIVLAIFALAILLPSLAVAVRRLHDVGKGGGWIFINLVPLVGSIWYLILMFKNSEAGENRFGQCPK